jgi:hypothetical protein
MKIENTLKNAGNNCEYLNDCRGENDNNHSGKMGILLIFLTALRLKEATQRLNGICLLFRFIMPPA